MDIMDICMQLVLSLTEVDSVQRIPDIRLLSDSIPFFGGRAVRVIRTFADKEIFFPTKKYLFDSKDYLSVEKLLLKGR